MMKTLDRSETFFKQNVKKENTMFQVTDFATISQIAIIVGNYHVAS